MRMRTPAFVLFAFSLLPALPGVIVPAEAGTAQFIGSEYQAGTGGGGNVAGTIRRGDPAGDPVFAAWLDSAGLSLADVSHSTGETPHAVWGRIENPASSVTSLDFYIGNTLVTASIAAWDDALQAPANPGGARLSTYGLNGSSLQDGAPRPGFASGPGSGYYIGTTGGLNNGLRNAVNFDLSNFEGGGVYSFGIFGGDLETGAPGAPLGFLRVTFVDDSTEIIPYLPDSTLFPNATWDGNNNISETYGNETTRFIGIVSDTLRIKSALFVVGDDDLNGDGTDEQLSFIAGGITFLDRDGNPFAPIRVPEPSAAAFLSLAGFGALARRRRGAMKSL